MPVTSSGLFTATFKAILDTTQLAVDLLAATNKCAMFTNSITPDFDAVLASAGYGVGQYAANEVNGAGYTAGGALITTPTVSAAGGLTTFDADPVVWAASTITNARCALIYADALAGNNAIVLVDFGADYSTINGQFSIDWTAAGVFYLDLVP